MNKRNSKQNLTRDIDIKNNLSVTRGEVGEDNEGRGEGFSGTSKKDTWTNELGVEAREGGGFGWGGGVVRGKHRQLQLNYNIIVKKKERAV